MLGRDRHYLGHMLDAGRRASVKVAGLSRSDYDGDDNLQLALLHLVQVIGEAARRVSPQTQQANAAIPWSTTSENRRGPRRFGL